MISFGIQYLKNADIILVGMTTEFILLKKLSGFFWNAELHMIVPTLDHFISTKIIAELIQSCIIDNTCKACIIVHIQCG